MKAIKAKVHDNKQGLVAVEHIELAYVVRNGNFWNVKMRLTSGYEVSSFDYTGRAEAEGVLAHLFD